MDVDQSLNDVCDEIELVKCQLAELEQRKATLKDRLKALKARALILEEERDRAPDTSTHIWDDEVKQCLKRVFNFDSFRTMQLEAINTVLNKHDVMITMSTGAGKSLCYQLPAVMQTEGVTLVISPLLSLMDDQIMHLKELNIHAAALNAHTPKEETTRLLNTICDKKSPLRLLYVTPEKIAKSKRLMNKLEKSYESGLLKMVAIDEVHCCSQWGHDFRPDYKFLGILKKQFPKAPIMGLTATATFHVLNDVRQILGIPSCRTIRAPFNRKNLFYEVIQKPEAQKDVTDLIFDLVTKDFANQTGIIYCLSRKDCEDLTSELLERGAKCAFYHGDLDVHQRRHVHEAWGRGKVQAIVATLAFGMGIDKPDVRFVIHHSVAKTMENYYQESGRAGRDGLPARCVVLYRLGDVFRQSTLNCSDSAEQFNHLYGMMTYCSQTHECRRKSLAAHFGEQYDSSWCERGCDFCIGGATEEPIEVDVTKYVNIIFDTLKDQAKTKSRVTGKKLIDLVSKKVKNASRTFLDVVLAHLLAYGQVREDFHFTPYSVISYIVPAVADPSSTTLSMNPSLVPFDGPPPKKRRVKKDE